MFSFQAEGFLPTSYVTATVFFCSLCYCSLHSRSKHRKIQAVVERSCTWFCCLSCLVAMSKERLTQGRERAPSPALSLHGYWQHPPGTPFSSPSEPRRRSLSRPQVS